MILIYLHHLLSSLLKNYMIKPEIKKKKMSGMNFLGVLAGARPRAYLLIEADSCHKCFTLVFNFAKQDKMSKDH